MRPTRRRVGAGLSDRVTLIDGTGLVYRAWHALPRSLKTTTGLHTNAIFGFAQMFRKVLAGRFPRYGAVVFDAPGGTFRTELDPGYKASRPPMPGELRAQLPLIDRLVTAHNFPILRVPGVEADDVIGTLATRALAAGHEVWIVSGDKDFAQLVTSDRVRLYDSTQDVVYDSSRLFKRFGVQPEQFVDWLALVGDAVDEIPGVRGIGKQGAADLLRDHRTLDAVLDAAEAIGGRVGGALTRGAAAARHSRELARIRCDLPLDVDLTALELTFPTPEALDAIYLELEFHSLLSAQAPRPGTQPAARHFVCDSLEMAAAALAAECHGPDPVAVVALTEFPTPLVGDLAGLALCPQPGLALYFPIRGPGAVLGRAGLDLLKPWLEAHDRPKIAHDAKACTVALDRVGITLGGVVGDTALGSYLVDPTLHLPHRLEQVSREYLKRGLAPLRAVVGSGRDTRRFDALTVDKAGAWACHQADAIRSVWPELETRLRTRRQWRYLQELDLPLTPALAAMERAGIAVDAEPLHAMDARFKAERTALRREIEALAGRPFNPGSLKQLGEVLFEELRLPVLGRTKTGYATTSEVLEKLAHHHPIVPKLLRWRTVAKLIDAYTEVLLAAIGPDGRIHPTFQQTVSASGRLITTEPDLQRTPVRTDEFREVRTAFVASPGNRLISADWSQIELRILAHASGDPKLVEAYRTGADVHTATASQLFGLPPEEIGTHQRQVGKTVNFATIYGQGATALAEQLGLSRPEAQRYIDTFFAWYDGVRRWRDAVVSQAYVDGFVQTLMGRRRYLPELSSNNWNDRSYGERIAMNTPIQGSAADLCKVAMLAVHRGFHARGLAARMVLQIHDELLVECPEAEVDAATQVLREAMTGAMTLSVPLVVDLGVGRTWAEAG